MAIDILDLLSPAPPFRLASAPTVPAAQVCGIGYLRLSINGSGSLRTTAVGSGSLRACDVGTTILVAHGIILTEDGLPVLTEGGLPVDVEV